jgi:hypothetical protein
VPETEPQKIQLTLSPQAERYARHDAPREARLMAARGALPLPPVELATVLFVLHHDPDPEIKSLARESLESLPDSVCDAVLTGDTHPAVLSHLAHAHKEKAEQLEKIALNPHTDDATIAYLAALPFKSIVDIVSNNQERMLRCSDIVESLGNNPLTGRSVIDRILSFLGIEGAGEDGRRAEPEEISESERERGLPRARRIQLPVLTDPEDDHRPEGQAGAGGQQGGPRPADSRSQPRDRHGGNHEPEDQRQRDRVHRTVAQRLR